MSKLATLTGHTLRVLYLAVSPDGQTIVTGAGMTLTPDSQPFTGSWSQDSWLGQTYQSMQLAHSLANGQHGQQCKFLIVKR